MKQYLIYYASLFGLVFFCNSSYAYVVDLFGTGTHLKHIIYSNTGSEAYQDCVEFAASHGYTNNNICTISFAGDIGAGWLQEQLGKIQLPFHAYVGKTPDYYLEAPQPTREGCTGNPIDYTSGVKWQTETDLYIHGIPFQRYYNSRAVSPGNAMGMHWRHSFDAQLDDIKPQLEADKIIYLKSENASTNTEDHSIGKASFPLGGIHSSPKQACSMGWALMRDEFQGGVFEDADSELIGQTLCEISMDGVAVAHLNVTPTSGYRVASPLLAEDPIKTLIRPDGQAYRFRRQGDSEHYAPLNARGVRLEKNGDLWLFYDKDGTIETFSESLLLSRQLPNGRLLTVERDELGRLAHILEGNTTLFSFTYSEEAADTGQITQVTSSGHTLTYGYDDKRRLTTVTHGTTALATYHYEDGDFPYALTGITDGRNIRYATWHYDDQGRAIRSEHAGGLEGVDIDYSFLDHPTSPEVTVTNPLGKNTTYHFGWVNAQRRVVYVEGHASEHCEAANQYTTYTPGGRVETQTDWAGNVTYYQRDLQGRVVHEHRGYRWQDNTPQYGVVDNVHDLLVVPPSIEKVVTISTCWDGDSLNPERIIEADRVTVFEYDQHRLTHRQALARTSSNAQCP